MMKQILEKYDYTKRTLFYPLPLSWLFGTKLKPTWTWVKCGVPRLVTHPPTFPQLTNLFLPISPNSSADSAQTQQVYQMTTEFCSSWCSWHLGDTGSVLLAAAAVAHIRILLPADFFWKDYQIRFCSAEPQ